MSDELSDEKHGVFAYLLALVSSSRSSCLHNNMCFFWNEGRKMSLLLLQGNQALIHETSDSLIDEDTSSQNTVLHNFSHVINKDFGKPDSDISFLSSIFQSNNRLRCQQTN